MATSTKTHDYMGRALQNATPGVTNPVRDFVGRNTTSTLDYTARVLILNQLGSIAGTVTDGADPIEDATVTAGGRTATTNGDGEYLLEDLQPATAYSVVASADGFDDMTLEGVAVGFGEDVTGVDLELDAS